jgi:hypothetical protein
LSNDRGKRANQIANLRPGRHLAPLGNTREVTRGGYAKVTARELVDKTCRSSRRWALDAPVRELTGTAFSLERASRPSSSAIESSSVLRDQQEWERDLIRRFAMPAQAVQESA